MESHCRALIYATDTLHISQAFPSQHLQKVVHCIKEQCEKEIPEYEKNQKNQQLGKKKKKIYRKSSWEETNHIRNAWFNFFPLHFVLVFIKPENPSSFWVGHFLFLDKRTILKWKYSFKFYSF